MQSSENQFQAQVGEPAAGSTAAAGEALEAAEEARTGPKVQLQSSVDQSLSRYSGSSSSSDEDLSIPREADSCVLEKSRKRQFTAFTNDDVVRLLKEKGELVEGHLSIPKKTAICVLEKLKSAYVLESSSLDNAVEILSVFEGKDEALVGFSPVSEEQLSDSKVQFNKKIFGPNCAFFKLRLTNGGGALFFFSKKKNRLYLFNYKS